MICANPEYGAEKIILGADAMNEKIAVSGWQEDSGLDIYEFVEGYVSKGVSKVISTDISKDGMLSGPSFSLYERLLDRFNGLYVVVYRLLMQRGCEVEKTAYLPPESLLTL